MDSDNTPKDTCSDLENNNCLNLPDDEKAASQRSDSARTAHDLNLSKPTPSLQLFFFIFAITGLASYLSAVFLTPLIASIGFMAAITFVSPVLVATMVAAVLPAIVIAGVFLCFFTTDANTLNKVVSFLFPILIGVSAGILFFFLSSTVAIIGICAIVLVTCVCALIFRKDADGHWNLSVANPSSISRALNVQDRESEAIALNKIKALIQQADGALNENSGSNSESDPDTYLEDPKNAEGRESKLIESKLKGLVITLITHCDDEFDVENATDDSVKGYSYNYHNKNKSAYAKGELTAQMTELYVYALAHTFISHYNENMEQQSMTANDAISDVFKSIDPTDGDYLLLDAMCLTRPRSPEVASDTVEKEMQVPSVSASK